jgi:hypothetical protein
VVNVQLERAGARLASVLNAAFLSLLERDLLRPGERREAGTIGPQLLPRSVEGERGHRSSRKLTSKRRQILTRFCIGKGQSKRM